MNHCIAKTSLRKVYTWGDNSKGQLGFGHYIRVKKPKIMDYLTKTAVNVQQVAASAYGCIVMDVNSRLYWWGTNGSIKGCTIPQ
jgi:myosin-5